MNYLVLLLRLVHVISGIFWVGSVLLLFFILGPTINSSGEAGQKIMGLLQTRARLTAVLSAAAGLTVLAGGSLYWIDSNGFTSAWLRSGPGIGFGLGAFFALVGFVFGIIAGRTNQAMAALGAQMQSQPSPEQVSRMAALRNRAMRIGPLNAWALILAAVFMATARYFSF